MMDADARAVSTREAGPGEVGPQTPLQLLTARQRSTLLAVDDYVRSTGEACPGRYLSRRLKLHHSTVQRLLTVLHRKGWLQAPTAPSRTARHPG